jgi:hypothetical protein
MEAADPWEGLEQDLHHQHDWQEWIASFDIHDSDWCEKQFKKERQRKKDRRRQVPNVNEMLDSKYLKQSDFDEDTIVTIEKIGSANLARDDQEPEFKWLCRFIEFRKAMVLNKTNIRLLSKVCGSADTEDWIGKEVIVYVDETVSFGGDIVGGLRIRANKAAAAPKKADKIVEEKEDDLGDIPF